MTNTTLKETARAFEGELRPTAQDIREFLKSLKAELTDICVAEIQEIVSGKEDVMLSSEYRGNDYARFGLQVFMGVREVMGARNCEYSSPYQREIDLEPVSTRESRHYVGNYFSIQIFKSKEGLFLLSEETPQKKLTLLVESQDMGIDLPAKLAPGSLNFVSSSRDKASETQKFTWEEKGQPLKRLVAFILSYASPDVSERLLPSEESTIDLKLMAAQSPQPII